MNNVTYFKDCVTIMLSGWQTFTVSFKKLLLCPAYCFNCIGCCWCYSLAYQQLCSDGSQDQKHSQYSCGDRCCYLAAAGIWSIRFAEKP